MRPDSSWEWQSHGGRQLLCRSGRLLELWATVCDRARAGRACASFHREAQKGLGHRRWCRHRPPLRRMGLGETPYLGNLARHGGGCGHPAAGAVTVCRCCSPVRAAMRSAGGADRAGRGETLCFGQSTCEAGAMGSLEKWKIGDSDRRGGGLFTRWRLEP